MSNAIAAAREAEAETQTWILCWQAALGRDFLAHPSLATKIRNRLISAHHASDRVLIDFVLLPTEILAITRLHREDSVAAVARAFGNVLSRWVREVQPIYSPVLAGPYSAQLLETEDEVRREIRMLAWRPVLKQACNRPDRYPHSALRNALGLTTAKGFNARPLLMYFGETVPLARPALSLWLKKPPSDEEWRGWELSRGLKLATGSVGRHPFMAKKVGGLAAEFIAAGGSFSIDGALELLAVWVGARLQPSDPIDLLVTAGPLGARGRALVGCLAVALHLCSAASVGRYFSRSKATLSEQMTLCRSRPADRQILMTPRRRILEEAPALLKERRLRKLDIQ